MLIHTVALVTSSEFKPVQGPKRYHDCYERDTDRKLSTCLASTAKAQTAEHHKTSPSSRLAPALLDHRSTISPQAQTVLYNANEARVYPFGSEKPTIRVFRNVGRMPAMWTKDIPSSWAPPPV